MKFTDKLNKNELNVLYELMKRITSKKEFRNTDKTDAEYLKRRIEAIIKNGNNR